MKEILAHLRVNWIRHAFETAVVVIGILLAFSLNNWNENRKENKIRLSYLNRLKNDLIADNENLNELISGRLDHISAYEEYLAFYESGNYTLSELLDSARLSPFGLHRYLPVDITYQELISTGNIEGINEELRISLAELEKLKDFFGIINSSVINGLFFMRREVQKYHDGSQTGMGKRLELVGNEELVKQGLLLMNNALGHAYRWALENIDRYKELISENNKIIQLIDAELEP
jgi:hypothetical protein